MGQKLAGERRRRDVWARLEHAIVSGSIWVCIVWVAAMLTAATAARIAWGLAPQRPPLPVEQGAPVLPPPPKALVLEATGYSQSEEEGTADGITASGLPVARGMCAADPAMLPQGTILLVDGYGYCVVGDVGSAIWGARLDLFFPTREEAFAWGRKTIVAQVVKPGERLE